MFRFLWFMISVWGSLTAASPLSRTADLSYLGPAVFGNPNNDTGKVLENWNENHPQNPEELGEYAEGDILFPQYLSRNGRNGMVAETYRWPDATVPYEISAYYPSKDREIIQRAMDIYHKYTCIKFRPKTASDKDYISIVSGASGCWSSVGRIGGRQEVNLQQPYCTTKVGTPIHELMHCLGFLHEQNRYERDDYVTIAWPNIKSGHTRNFNKADKDTTDGFGVPYDYRSVMHYSPTAFSSNGKPTIIPKDSSKNMKMGQRDGFSRGDILKLNAMYKCPNKDPAAGTGSNSVNPDDVVGVSSASGNGDSNGGAAGGLLNFLFQIVN